MDYEFNPGDRVRLTRPGVTFYGGAWPNFVPQGQGGGTVGTVVTAEDRPHKPGAAPRPYFVHWDNGSENSYRIEDLQAAEDTKEAAEPITEPVSNIVPFKRKQ